MPFTPERDSTVDESARCQSPPTQSPVRYNPTRPRRPPPITPRRFTKFFTPRLSHGHRSVRTSRTALQHLSGPVLNQRANPTRRHKNDHGKQTSVSAGKPRGQKRKLSFTSIESTPHRPAAFFLPSSQEAPDDHEGSGNLCAHSPSKHVNIFEDCGVDEGEEEEEEEEFTIDGEEDEDRDEDEDDDDEDGSMKATRTCQPLPAVRQYSKIGVSSSLLSSKISGRRTRAEPAGSNAWQHETSDFYSSRSEIYSCTSLHGPARTLPFCTASCNTNSLIAIGDEQGGVRLVDSARDDRDGFTKHYLALHQVHNNALMDLTFSEDDGLLATASGDQEGHIVDMRTQQTTSRLCGHTASVKRVQFQPGSFGNVLATCSRDGNINIWDLRSQSDRPSLHLRSSTSAQAGDGLPKRSPSNHIRSAHTASYANYRNADDATIEWARERGRYTDSSVTSLAFLPDSSRGHLLFSGSEADSTIKLWDLRTLYNARRPRPHPVSTTEEPPSHHLHRRYGLTSLAFSSDGARLYSLCRDHTVYAYSTSHLILGDAPELSTTTTRPRRPGGPERPGLGPLYGLRHSKFSVSTFYLKLAIRKATAEKPELLAIGSSDNCAIIFPTSERYLNSSTKRANVPGSTFSFDGTKCSRHEVPTSNMHCKSAETSLSSVQEYQSLPIYEHGTALVRGHEKEVTAVTWNYDGSLTTVSDDFTVRCWREDDFQARQLRQRGEAEGRRWLCGWAEVGDESYDIEDS